MQSLPPSLARRASSRANTHSRWVPSTQVEINQREITRRRIQSERGRRPRVGKRILNPPPHANQIHTGLEERERETLYGWIDCVVYTVCVDTV